MAFVAVFGRFVFIDVVCVNGPVHFTCRSKWYLCLGLDWIPGLPDTNIVLLNQLAGIRGFPPRIFLCDQLLFPHRLDRTMTIDDPSTRSRLDTDNFRPN